MGGIGDRIVKKKVFVTRAIPEAGLELLRRDCDVEVSPHDRVLTKQELMDAAPATATVGREE